jgi:hypothetical protein
MGAYKQFTTQDIIITPFNVKKGFTFLSNEFTSSDVGIDRFIGKNISNDILFSPLTSSSEPTTGFLTTQYQRLVYNSIKQLYYTNYITNPIPTSSDFIGQDVYSRFDNYLQSPNLDYRTFPTGTNDEIGVISIPSKLFGNRIHPGSFKYEQNYPSSHTQSIIFSASSISSNEQLYITELTVNNFSASTDILNGLTYLDYSGIATASNAAYLFNQSYTSSLSFTASLDLIFTASLGNEITFYINSGTGNNTGTFLYSQSISYTTTGNPIVSMSFLITQSILPTINTNYSLFFTNTGITMDVFSASISIIEPAYTAPYTSSVWIYDDCEGNIYNSLNNTVCGNIIYPHGLITITSGNFHNNLIEFTTGSGVTCSFSSSMTIFETQYKCTIRENEFNFSLNPSLMSGSEGNVYNFVTGSIFTPYATTVGLYNENQELLAIAKLAKPLNSSDTTDTTILINFDR